MFSPDWEVGCKSCSFWADNFNGIDAHLRQRDVNLVAISRAPLSTLQAFANRMGWTFPWVSSGNGDFNFDYHVSFAADALSRGPVSYNYTLREGGPELPGISVFYRDEDGAIFHTWPATVVTIKGVPPPAGSVASRSVPAAMWCWMA